MPAPKVISSSCRIAVILWLAVGTARVLAGTSDVVQFNRDIRPILSDNCFQCHGPDQAQRKANLRLDVEQNAKAALADGGHAIVPGDRAHSELARRIANPAAEERMPPLKSGKKLSAAQIELIARWIDQGARWEKHWAFIPPTRSALPPVARMDWARNAIDTFALARIERAGLAPSAEADRTTLIRRVTLDLTGLPPTPDEVDAFAADKAADAYERVVDRLLASPRYGERMAARWLDAARYADTSGYQTDGIRHMWRWRDWVIEAYNRNLPFDQFTLEQIAGDLLPGATLEQQIATGFNRNHRGNAEGGIIPEEYAAEYVIDRVDTTATVWLGLTLACARCHDHKFDPFTQREFYQLFAYFNNVPEKGRAVKVGNSPPLVKAPTRDQQHVLHSLDEQLSAAEREFSQLQGQVASGEGQWSASLATSPPILWAPSASLSAHFPLDEDAREAVHGARRELVPELRFTPGAIGAAAAFDGESEIDMGNLANFGYFDKFTFSAWIFANSDSGTILSRMSNVADADGYNLVLANAKLQLNLVKRWLDDSLRLETDESLAAGAWHHVAVSYDGSRAASGVNIHVDGRPQKIKVLLDELNQSFASTEPLRIGGGGSAGRFHGLIDDVRVYNTDLSAADVQLLACRDSINAIAATSAANRTSAQAAKLRACYLENHAPPAVQSAHRAILELRQRKLELEDSFPTTMVMQEMPTPRETFILARGQYDKPGERVSPGVPASLNPLVPDTPPNRLSLARWLVDPANPLTARVAVNRFWQSYFGTGLVKTVDDFGAQGDAPSHPELLDWLASEFAASGWDIKALQKLIVMSATYRQSSKITAAGHERDPGNRLLARGPRLRLSAEMIRDQSLAASGLLVEQSGGPSVNPYQPPGLWKELTGGGDVEQDHGASLYRRSLYTFWKRTIAPPSMMTFDASGREACSVRETRTNTPLQALTLMNEITFVECARALAQRVLAVPSATPAERLARAFRLTLARAPSASELNILEQNLNRQLTYFRQQPTAAERLLHVGESPRDMFADCAELAAYTAVANLIMNLDEVVTKE